MAKQADNIYSTPKTQRKPFEFNDEVTRVFDDMIRRSVPGYAQVLGYLPTLVRRLNAELIPEQRSFRYADLGCSLGAGLVALAKGLDTNSDQHKQSRFLGLDTSAPMLAQANDALGSFFSERGLELQLLQHDILKHDFQPTDLFLLNFTLQFIELQSRDSLVEKLFDALSVGGYLVLSEKICFEDPVVNETLIGVHHQFKADQGYSDLEISQKRDAIENVLIPETLNIHVDRLSKAGFRVVTPWLQNMQFVSILAIK